MSNARALDYRINQTALIVTLLTGCLLAYATSVWFMSVDSLENYFREGVPAGQLPYIFSKLTGLYAIALLWVQMMVGLLPLKKKHATHRWIGALTMLAIVMHFSLFVTAASIRSDHFAYAILIPDFFGSFYKLSVSLGVVSVWLLVAVVAAGIYRMRRSISGNQLWIVMHRLSIVAVLLAFFHSYWIGSETRNLSILLFYNSMLITIMMALFYRFWWLRFRRKPE